MAEPQTNGSIEVGGADFDISREATQGKALGELHNLDSPALDGLLADAPENRPGYETDLAISAAVYVRFRRTPARRFGT